LFQSGGAEEVEVGQKAVGTDARGGAGSAPARKDEPAATRVPSRARPASPRKSAPSAATALSATLKGFVATLHKQAERHTDVIDVFARALKDLNREVKDERMRREILERRLRESEGRVEELARVVAALGRQGWVH
jgi:hypothetical protein